MSDTKYLAGLYLRLSKDDERAGESVSIENQRLLLTNYAQEKGWEIREIYIDDGWSGTTMNRPAFQRMMRDVEDRLINLVIVKDLSRLGRNYIEVGRLTEETLPRLGCRFVALNDSERKTPITLISAASFTEQAAQCVHAIRFVSKPCFQ